MYEVFETNNFISIAGHPHRPGGAGHRVLQDGPLRGDVRLDHNLLQLPLHAQMGELAHWRLDLDNHQHTNMLFMSYFR